MKVGSRLLVTMTAAAVLAACATTRAPSAPIPAPPLPPPEMTRLIEQGCYRCFERALTLAIEHNAPQLAFEAAALLALRSNELGLPAATRIAQARELAAGDATRSMYVDMIVAVPPDSLSGAREEIVADTRSRIRDRGMVPRWREMLATGPGSDAFRRYLDLSLLCTIDPFRDRDEDLQAIVEHLPMVPLLQYRAGICRSQFAGRLSAVRDRDEALVEADYMLGRYALEGGEAHNPDEALRRLRSAAAAFPDSPAITTTLGHLYKSWEAWPEALAAYDAAVALVPNHPDALLGRTESLSYLERHRDAIDTATRLIEGRWFLGQAHYWRAWNHFNLGDAATARIEADRTRSLMVNAAVFVLSGMIEWRLGRPVNAEKEFEEALVMDFGQCEAALMLGGVRAEMRKADQAVAALQQARQCFDLSIAVRRKAIDVITAGPDTPVAKAREIGRHERAIAQAESRRGDAEKAIATISRR